MDYTTLDKANQLKQNIESLQKDLDNLQLTNQIEFSINKNSGPHVVVLTERTNNNFMATNARLLKEYLIQRIQLEISSLTDQFIQL